MIIVFLTESPYLDYTLILFFCVSWRTYLYANSDPRSHNSNPSDYTSSLESALKLPFFIVTVHLVNLDCLIKKKPKMIVMDI